MRPLIVLVRPSRAGAHPVSRRRGARQTLPAAVLLLLAALAGCASPTPERFYMLAAGSPQQRVQFAGAACSVAVGPVTVPAMVDRPQMVMRTGPNRVMITEQSRWAEPLKDGIARAVAADLAQLLGKAWVSAYSQETVLDADYRVPIDVQRFESAPGVAATIDVLWAVRASGHTLRSGRSVIREPVERGGEEALVAAHERALAALSRDIAAALREVGSAR
jgi:uncharacterized lipoprotein YmbA